jgi:proteasome lid subunit RPN8/RPN11
MNFKPLEFYPGIWRSLIADLRKRGRGERESGAFLLGTVTATSKVVQTWLPYDQIDPRSLNYEYVRLSTEAFSRLWNICEQRGFEVVGDVHTHPSGPRQSPSDRANPMISMTGHMALIVPNFAIGDVNPKDVSLNIYLGSKQWQSLFGQDAANFIKVS